MLASNTSSLYLAGEKLEGEKGTAGLLFRPVNRFNGAFSGVCCLLLDAVFKTNHTIKYLCTLFYNSEY